jgi:cytidyltransferase-like protein
MIKVFVSGCFDGLIHGGHIEFFKQAKALGDYLIVSFASDNSLLLHKNRKPSLPMEHKIKLLESLNMINKVMVSNDDILGLDFKTNFLQEKPDILAVTEDDKYSELKKELCNQVGAKYVVLPKTLEYTKISTTEILNNIKAPKEVPLRVDFAGMWLDVPRFKRDDGYIVNCTVTPMVSLNKWNYPMSCGMGGSGAYAILSGKNAIQSEMIDNNVGWQDPAVILETGLCVWKSGDLPELYYKTNPDFLYGKMALLYNNSNHSTKDIANKERDYDLIEEASETAMLGVRFRLLSELGCAMNQTYQAQIKEGMNILPDYNELGKCYQGSGYSMALYLFLNENDRNQFLQLENTYKIEPYIRSYI